MSRASRRAWAGGRRASTRNGQAGGGRNDCLSRGRGYTRKAESGRRPRGRSLGGAALPANAGDTETAATRVATLMLEGDALATSALCVLEAASALGAMPVLLASLSVALITFHGEVDIEVGDQVEGRGSKVTVRAADLGLILEVRLDALSAAAAFGAAKKRALATARTLELAITGPSRSGDTR